MTEDEKKRLDIFETQLRHLIAMHEELKRENIELKRQIDMERLKNEKIQAQYDELEANYTNLKIGTAISLNTADVKEVKKLLSDMVREIDECIAAASSY